MILAQQTVDAIQAIAASGGTEEEKLQRARSCIDGCRNTARALVRVLSAQAGSLDPGRDSDWAMGDLSTALGRIAEVEQARRPHKADFYDRVRRYAL